MENDVLNLQERIASTRSELKRAKGQLKLMKNELKRATDAKAFCIARAQEHADEHQNHIAEILCNHREEIDRLHNGNLAIVWKTAVEIDTFKSKIQELEATDATKAEYRKY